VEGILQVSDMRF